MKKARILHISDAHLPDGAKPADDIKDSRLVYDDEPRTRLDRVKQSLTEYVQSRGSGPKVTTLVVSGDFTSKGDPDANAALVELVELLGPALGDECPLVIVPGNHDVARGKRGSEDYYSFEIAGHRLRLVLPFCGPDSEPEQAYWIDREHAVLFVAVNSSEYSGADRKIDEVKASLERLAEGASDGTRPDYETLTKFLAEASNVDATRLTKDQIDFLATVMRLAEAEWKELKDGRDLLRIAVLHHHLLPVTPREELKPYESIVNLAQVRQFLAVNRIDLALHGHKHRFFYYYDYVPDLLAPERPYHRVLVVSAPSLLGDLADGPAFLEIEASALRPPTIEIVPYGLGHGAFPLRRFPAITKRLYDHGDTAARGGGFPVGIEADSVTEAHGRMLDTLRSQGSEASNFWCHVGDVGKDWGKLVGELAGLFAQQEKEMFDDTPHEARPSRQPADPADRFRQIVDWWQMDNNGPSVGFRFTHGSRVRNHSQAVDQLAAAKRRLRGGSMTTKAVVNLLDPPRDLAPKGNFPSFCLLQFIVREEEGGRVLDCIAYFRKQEIRQWWLVNFAEIVKMRNEVLNSVSTGEAGLRPGCVTTIAGRAKVADVPPQVSVPAIDRDAASDEGRARISNMVYALASGDRGVRGSGVKEWRLYFNDLRPPQEYDADGIPVAVPGLQFLKALLKSLGEQKPSWERLRNMIGELANGNKSFLSETASEEANPTELFAEWKDSSERRIKDILVLVQELSGD